MVKTIVKFYNEDKLLGTWTLEGINAIGAESEVWNSFRNGYYVFLNEEEQAVHAIKEDFITNIIMQSQSNSN